MVHFKVLKNSYYIPMRTWDEIKGTAGRKHVDSNTCDGIKLDFNVCFDTIERHIDVHRAMLGYFHSHCEKVIASKLLYENFS